MNLVLTVEPSQCILRHQQPGNSHVRMARPCTPSHTVQACLVDESCEYERAGLMRGRFCEDGDGECEGPDGVPSHGNVIQVFEDVYTEGVYETW